MLAKIDITLGQGLELVAERALRRSRPGQVGRWRASARGVLAVLGPFNFPGHLVHGHVVPALATGNCVVVKPSEKTPATGQLYAELAQRAGFPPGVVNLVQGDGAVGARARRAPAVSTACCSRARGRSGRRILEATLDQPWKLVALEMGGKNGVLVCADADLDAAAAAIAFGACVTAGQRCSATSRVFAARADRGRAVRAARAPVPRHRDRPLVATTGVFMGPLISRAARERHAQVLALGRGRGRARRSSPAARARVRAPATTCGPSLHRLRAHDPREPLPERGALRARRVRARRRLGRRGPRAARRDRLRPGRERLHARARASTSARRATLRVGAAELERDHGGRVVEAARSAA